MEARIITVKGHPYRREVEMLGDVEKVRWFNTKMSGYSEVLEQDWLDELEAAFDEIRFLDIIPPSFYI